MRSVYGIKLVYKKITNDLNSILCLQEAVFHPTNVDSVCLYWHVLRKDRNNIHG